MNEANIEFPCPVCGAPAKPDRICGRCNTCELNTCTSCSRRCDRCGRTFCEDHVESRVLMIQQVACSKLLCENFVKFDLPRKEQDLQAHAKAEEVMDAVDRSPKQKLTLGLDKEVIDRARSAGINISAITENVLKAMTYDPLGDTKGDIVGAYEKLFEGARRLLARYNAEVEVGGRFDHTINLSMLPIKGEKITLDSSGALWKYDISVPSAIVFPPRDYKTRTSISDVVPMLYPPMRILENVIVALTEAAEKNKERMKEFEIALRFIKALSEQDKPK